MPETPDFDQIARVAVMTFYDTTPRHSVAEGEAVKRIAEQLRLVWNARGAADLAKIDVVLATLMGGTTSGPYVNQLNTAIRALDRSA